MRGNCKWSWHNSWTTTLAWSVRGRVHSRVPAVGSELEDRERKRSSLIVEMCAKEFRAFENNSKMFGKTARSIVKIEDETRSLVVL